MTNTNTKATATNATLVNALVFNNRFATARLNAEQLSAETFADWKSMVDKLHRAAYKVYCKCENNGMKVADTTVDKTEVYDAIRTILATIGEVNEHKLYANEETAITVIGYAGKRANVDAPELQFCNSRLNNLRRELKKYQELSVTDAEHKAKNIKAMEEDIEKLVLEQKELLATADMRHKMPTKTNENAFRLDVEHYLARTISGQLAKTLEELDAEEAARKEARKAAAKKRKAAKAEAETK